MRHTTTPSAKTTVNHQTRWAQGIRTDGVLDIRFTRAKAWKLSRTMLTRCGILDDLTTILTMTVVASTAQHPVDSVNEPIVSAKILVLLVFLVPRVLQLSYAGLMCHWTFFSTIGTYRKTNVVIGSKKINIPGMKSTLSTWPSIRDCCDSP